MVSFCLGICGGCLGGVMVLGMSSLCHDVGLGYGVCSLVGFFIDDAGLGLGWWMECLVFGGVVACGVGRGFSWVIGW